MDKLLPINVAKEASPQACSVRLAVAEGVEQLGEIGTSAKEVPLKLSNS